MKGLVQEYKLSVDMMLVVSDQNLADKMTCVSQRWLDMAKKRAQHVNKVCTASLGTMNPSEMMQVYQRSGHTGVRRAIYFGRSVCFPLQRPWKKRPLGPVWSSQQILCRSIVKRANWG